MYGSKLEKDFHSEWKKQTRVALTLQHKFHPRRKWRFDFAHLPSQVAIEIQGFGEGHTSYKGMRADYDKHNEAARYGWIILYIMSCDIQPNRISKTIAYILDTIDLRPPEVVRAVRSKKPAAIEPKMSTYEKAIRRVLDGRL